MKCKGGLTENLIFLVCSFVRNRFLSGPCRIPPRIASFSALWPYPAVSMFGGILAWKAPPGHTISLAQSRTVFSACTENFVRIFRWHYKLRNNKINKLMLE